MANSKELDKSTYAGKAVSAVRTKARGILGDGMSSYVLIDVVGLMLLNNKFASKGIFITDENREEQYIKVIELGEDDLIEDLEKYIDLRDKIKELEDKRTEYERIITQLTEMENPNDQAMVNGIIKDYLKR